VQPSDTSELMERLEDSLMTLGSMATNRYAAPFRAEVQAWIRCGAVGCGRAGCGCCLSMHLCIGAGLHQVRGDVGRADVHMATAGPAAEA